jgi:hypothetical protein
MKGSSIYRVWIDIKSRCSNKNTKQYKDYGGRGITICDEWKNSFTAFYKDMGDIPFEGAQIDRKNVEEGYNKNNCRWATRSLNMANRRSSNRVLPRGVNKNGRTSTRYKATMQVEKVNYKLGVFDTIEEAANAHDLMFKEWYGND